MAKIIGRKAERQQLERLLDAKEAEFYLYMDVVEWGKHS